MVPVNVVVKESDFCTAPDPEITPEYENAAARLKMSVPEFTTLDVPMMPPLPPLPMLTVPAEIVSAPLKVLVPVRVRVPVPCLVTLPFVPEITPANVVEESLARVSVFAGLPVVLRVTVELVPSPEVAIDAMVSSKPARLKLALFATTTGDVSAIRFAAPSVIVPAETVVAPVYVFAPDSVSVPVPCLVSLPFVPSMTPANVVFVESPTVKVLVALVVLSVILAFVPSPGVAIDATVSSRPFKSRVALLAIDTADEFEMRSAEVPIASVPAEMVVAPVYVFAAVNVKIPAPVLVRPPEVVPMAPLIVDVPADSTVSV